MEHLKSELTKDPINSATPALKYFPAFASFILANHLDDFAKKILLFSRQEQIPLLKYFSTYSENDLLQLAKKSNAEMLALIADNNVQGYIDESVKNFTNNRIPVMEREDVLAEDITLAAMVRKRAFRSFLTMYTLDQQHFINVMEEVDRFIAITEAASFNTYLNIQNKKINTINTQLILQQQELLEAQELAEMGSFYWDMQYGNSTYTSKALNIFGIERPTNLAAFFDHVHPGDRDKLKAALDKAFKSNDGMYACEYTYIKDQREKRIWSRGVVTFENGVALGMRGSVMDITHKYLLLKRLEESEELNKKAQALTHIGNWSWDIPTNKITWSDEMYRIYGLEPQSEEINFERFISFVHPDDRELRLKQITESLQTLEAADYMLKIINPDGALKILKGKGAVIADLHQQPVKLHGTCQDITREYLLNKELKESEQNFKQLINNAPDAVIVINFNSEITLWNAKTEDIFGWTAAEAEGKQLADIIIPTRYHAAHKAGMKRFLDTGEARILNKTLQLEARKKSGDEFYISITISKTNKGSEPAFIAFIRDITIEKNIEIELAKKTSLLELKNFELERINKELESFNFAASHDLQEPLRKIQTFSNRILNNPHHSLSPENSRDLTKIMNASSRMQSLIEDLLSYSQNTLKSVEITPIHLNELIAEVEQSLTDFKDQHVTINMPQLPVIKVVKFQFIQLFANLIGNAIKYRKASIAPEITISGAIVDSAEVSIEGIPAHKKYLEIIVADNGIGFDQVYAEKIFGLFTRLHSKDDYPGTGIGLSTCKKIVHNHEGFIHAKSIPDKGARFFIYLPAACVVSP